MCQLPPTGVQGLTTDFRLVNIMETYSEVRKSFEKTPPKRCLVCQQEKESLPPSQVCAECESEKARPAETHVLGNCQLHNEPLTHFCQTCQRPACRVCFADKHRGDNHDVTQYSGVISTSKKKLKEEIQTVKEKLRQLREQETTYKLSNIREEERKQCETTGKELSTLTDIILRKNRAVMRERGVDIGRLRREVERLEKENQESHDQNERLLRRKHDLVMKVSEVMEKNEKDIASSTAKMKSIQEQANIGIERGERLMTETTLWVGLQDDIEKTTQELHELASARTMDILNPLAEAIGQRMTEVGGSNMSRKLLQLLSAAVGLPLTDPNRESSIKTAEAALDYLVSDGHCATASLAYKLELPGTEYLITDVTCMKTDRVAVSSAGKGYMLREFSYNVWLWNKPTEDPVLLRSDHVCVPCLKKLTEDELVILRRENPILLLVNVVTNSKKKIRVNLSKEAIASLKTVEVDYQGHYLLTQCNSKDNLMEDHMIMVDSNGDILQDIAIGRGALLAFSRLTGKLFSSSKALVTSGTRSEQTISMYQLLDRKFTKVKSGYDSLVAFQYLDMCSGSLGEIFVAGWFINEIKVYQMKVNETDDEEEIEMIPVEIPNADLTSHNFHGPRCSVALNQLVIGYKRNIKVFQLAK
jgi:hypothetical protein